MKKEEREYIESLTDKEIVEGILARDQQITSYFFCSECKGLFYYIHSQIFNLTADTH